MKKKRFVSLSGPPAAPSAERAYLSVVQWVLLQRCELAGKFTILRDFVPHDVVGGAYHCLRVHDVDVAPLGADVEPCAASSWQGATGDSVEGRGGVGILFKVGLSLGRPDSAVEVGSVLWDARFPLQLDGMNEPRRILPPPPLVQRGVAADSNELALRYEKGERERKIVSHPCGDCGLERFVAQGVGDTELQSLWAKTLDLRNQPSRAQRLSAGLRRSRDA